MKFPNWLKKTDSLEQFIDKLINNCHSLASERLKHNSIPVEKYQHLRDFVQILVFNSYAMTTLLEENGDINKKQFLFIFFEHLNFFIFFIDRTSSNVLDVQERSQLMRELTDLAFVLSIVTLLPDLEDNAKDTLFHQCMKNLIAVIEEYSKYNLIQTENDSGCENTVLWEFSKKIQEYTKDPYNIGGMIGRELEIVQALKNIDTKSFLQDFK